jgi:hypothetical protein
VRLSTIAAVHAGQMGYATMMQPRRSGPPPWVHTGLTQLVSDGASGSYAEAATNAAARVVFPGGALGVFTFSAWISPERNDAYVAAWIAGETSARLFVNQDSDPHDTAVIALPGMLGEIGAYALIDGGDHIVATFDGTTAALYCNGSSVGTNDPDPGDYAEGDTFRMFWALVADVYLGPIRTPALYARALSAGEVAALHTAGPTHDLRANVGAYTGGGPDHWWPGDGDAGTTVTDRGLVGGCNLTLHGGVTIEAVSP